MSERLDRIEGLLEQLFISQQQTQQQLSSTNRAVEALGTYTSTMGERLETNMENFTQTVNEALAAQDTRQRTTDQQIQALIDESRENNRQHNEFRNRIEALTESLQTLLAQVMSRVNDIWERMAA